MNGPLISCICVTKNHPDLLSKAIKCFKAQTYANKELILLYDESNLPTRDFLRKNVHNHCIKIFPVNGCFTLGALRNYAVENSNGDFFCQWDDDDWHNAFRLAFQYSAIKKNSYSACIIDQWILFDSLTEKAYLSGKRLWEGSLLCRKDMFLTKKYENVSRGEDTPLVEYLYHHKLLHLMEGLPELYIYNYHGGNTFDREHFNELFDYGTLMPPAVNLEIKKIMKLKYDVLGTSRLLNTLMRNEFSK